MSLFIQEVQKLLCIAQCFFPCLILAFSTQQSRAQLGFTVQHDAVDAEHEVIDRNVVVMRYGSGMLTLVDTFLLSNSPPFSTDISISEKFESGLFVLSIDGGRSFELILNDGKQPVITGTPEELMSGSGRIGRSLENEAYFSFVHLSAIADAKSEALRQEWSSLRVIDPQYYQKSLRVEENLFQLQRAFNRQLDSLGLLYASTYTANKLVPIAYFPLPSEAQKLEYETNSAFLYYHFFDGLDFAAYEVADNHIFHNRLRYYLSKIVPNEDEFQKLAIDRLLRLAEVNPNNFSHVAELLVAHYFNLRRDELVIYTHERYTENDCSLEQKLRVDDIVAGLNFNRKGNRAQELLLPDTAGTMRSLIETALANRVTMLLFWSSHCSVCMDEIPFFMRLFEQYEGEGLAVYAVNLDTQSQDWTATVKRFDPRWIDVQEPHSVQNSQVEKRYLVRQTPTLYLLNHNGEIISKNVFGSELKSILEGIL